jgi:hypothetical protein
MKFSAESVMRYPQSYRTCLNNSFFNAFEFWKWIGHALIESLLLVTPPMYMLTGLERTTGTISTFWQSGVLTFSCVVIQANIKLLFVQSRWTWYVLCYTFYSCLVMIVSAVLSVYGSLLAFSDTT